MNHMKGVDGVYFTMGVFLLLTVCSEPGMDLANDQDLEVTTRWYNDEQVRSGAVVRSVMVVMLKEQPVIGASA